MSDAVKSVDDLVGKLVAKVEEKGIKPKTNFIVASTPGYADVPLTQVIVLDKYAKGFTTIGTSPVLHVKPEEKSGKCEVLTVYTIMLT